MPDGRIIGFYDYTIKYFQYGHMDPPESPEINVDNLFWISLNDGKCTSLTDSEAELLYDDEQSYNALLMRIEEIDQVVAWTDYPIANLGDDNENAKIRECTPICYDGNKYAIVEICGKKYSIKAGYLYSKPGRWGAVPCLSAKRLYILTVDMEEFLSIQAGSI